MDEAAEKTDNDWRIQLTPEQYDVLRKKGTEAAFSGKYYDVKDDGTYVCAGCGQELFSSQAKYDSGSGWPSFVRPISDGVIEIRDDDSHGMHRKEVVCSRCGGHLGHVFADGPEQMDDGEPATGHRYCINSVALGLESKESEKT